MSEPHLPEALNPQSQPAPPLPSPHLSGKEERSALLEQLTQLQTLEQHHQERIQQLEQALDQSLTTLTELQQQVQDQEFLETQLASTEAFSHMQRQAIATLNQRLNQVQQALVEQTEVSTEKEQQFQQLLAAAEAMVKVEETESGYLQVHLNQSRAIAYLYQRLSLQQLADQSKTVTLNTDPTLVQAKLEELELEVAKQHILQARLQHGYQEATTERNAYEARVLELEQLVADMQEQILQQAQQAKEYETAIQHWKDRAITNQQATLLFKELLEHLLQGTSIDLTTILNLVEPIDLSQSQMAESDTFLSSLLAALRTSAILEPTDGNPSGISLSELASDLPDFLMRRRRKYSA
jgi:uncharacterized protein (DUF3084 family)